MSNQEDWHCTNHGWMRREFDRLQTDVSDLRNIVRTMNENIATLKVKAGFIGVFAAIGGAVAMLVWKYFESH